jgi:uroporphyrinogen III methyltransferase/synthase
MKAGKVYLVGAGPGDEKLITVRGLECLKRADVVVYDRLANPRLLRFARPDAEFIYCGKFPKHHTLRQEAINELLVQKAQSGYEVVRLKGGDPSVFGRVGEEAEELSRHGVEYEIVPGITSGIAASVYAGIPVTHREYGSNFAVVTGHAKTVDGKPLIDWASLARGIDTMAFYMGVSNLPHICKQLIAHGKSATTPVALISWGTTGRQKTVTGTLETIVAKAAEADIKNPAITLVGEIVQLRGRMNWFENKPLFGRRILVSRTGGEEGKLAAALTEQGADVTEYPYFAVRERADEAVEKVVSQSEEYDRILFTSPESATFFFAAYRRNGKDIRQLRATLYTLSRRTEHILKNMGFLSERACPVTEGGRILVVGDASLLQKQEQYEKEWGPCDVLAVYEKKECREYGSNMLRLLQEETVDTVIFPSAASVDTLIHSLTSSGIEPSVLLSSASLVCMGPKTAEAIERAGYRADMVTSSHSIEEVLRCLICEEVNI